VNVFQIKRELKISCIQIGKFIFVYNGMYLGINGSLYEAAFSDPHSSHKVFYLSDMELPGLPY
jgi:hypothetical protein